MFESLNDQIRQDTKPQTTTEKLIRIGIILGSCALVFGGFYFGIHLLD
jgi:hypothetical protein